jgi:hypothetical protein
MQVIKEDERENDENCPEGRLCCGLKGISKVKKS